jgi:putative folate metabolism gamma-glutamate ligase
MSKIAVIVNYKEMIVTPIKTDLVKEGDNLFEVISKNIKKLPEESILVITAKIISVCQGRVVEKKTDNKSEKHELIKKEADYYLDALESKYDVMLTIKNNILGINAGINESNANGKYILWPKDVQNVANDIWKFLRKHYSIKKVGVIITDSKIFPLKWGIVGTAVCHCGFKALYDYRSKKDIFGRKLSMSQINIAEALAVSAVLEMGEAADKLPLCIIEKVSKIEFQDRVPTQKELKNLIINIKDDVFAPVLGKTDWKKGKSGNFR